ncbi:MAG: 50S ribosomal protein L19e [archaeon]|nr:MAG: 50S ribosomal protein L19e [archaeon]
MKTFQAQKQMAARVMKVGVNKVYFDPERMDDIKEAVTKQDIVTLIKDKAIKKRPIRGVKKRAHKKKLERKKKGRRRGVGKVRKRVNKRKQTYVKKIRKIRDYLQKVKPLIPKEEFLKIKKLIKGGYITEIKDIKTKIGK